MDVLDPTATCVVCGAVTPYAVVVAAVVELDDDVDLARASTEVFAVCAAHWADQVVAHRQALDLLGTVDRFAESGLVPAVSAGAIAAAMSTRFCPVTDAR